MTDFTIKQGTTFSRVLRWESPTVVYKPITAIANSAPVSITSAAHNIPDGWRVNIQSVQGMKQLNALNTPPKTSDYHKATVVDQNTITLNDVNSLGYGPYTSGGVVAYNQPIDLAGYTARMQIKGKIADTVSILSLTSSPAAGLVLDNTAKTITITISADQTALLTFKTAVYSLEMVSLDGVVTEIMGGKITLEPEVTR
jgi:hypothetical protein